MLGKIRSGPLTRVTYSDKLNVMLSKSNRKIYRGQQSVLKHYMFGHPLVSSKCVKQRHFSKVIDEVITDRVHTLYYMNMVVAIFLSSPPFCLYVYDVNIITFYYPDTKVFYLFALKEGYHFAAPLLISLCEENLICLVL